jgi:signal transduction histidine kinase
MSRTASRLSPIKRPLLRDRRQPPVVRAPKSVKSKKALPAWALDRLLKRAKVAAWEGLVAPLRSVKIVPSDLPFLKALKTDDRTFDAWTEIIHPLDRARVKYFFDKLKAAALPTSIEYRVIDAQGSVAWVRHGVDELLKAGRAVKVRGFLEDIQREKEYQLESLRVSEREQHRIGQDLHDDLCQVLAGVSCLMRVFEGRIAAKAPEEVANLKELNQQIIDAMLRTRALTHGLFPGKVQISDIRGALLELASQVKARFPVEIKTEFAGRFPKHSNAQIIQIYRLAQEAISNAMKHGRATEIQVRLEAQTQTMELTVRDNGTGLASHENAEPGVGLSIMSYRAAALGGEVAVQNAATDGVIVRLSYPFESA